MFSDKNDIWRTLASIKIYIKKEGNQASQNKGIWTKSLGHWLWTLEKCAKTDFWGISHFHFILFRWNSHEVSSWVYGIPGVKKKFKKQ